MQCLKLQTTDFEDENIHITAKAVLCVTHNPEKPGDIGIDG